MSPARRAVLLSGDLMFQSRLRTALAAAGVSLTVSGPEEPAEPGEAVFVDLNTEAERRLEAIRALRASHPDLTVVAFTGHEEDAVRVRAMEAGATRCVTNGGLQTAALRALGAGVAGTPAGG